MSEQRPYPSQEKQSGQTRWFSFLYRTRVMVHQGDIPIVNLSLAFALLVAVSAPMGRSRRAGGGAGTGLPHSCGAKRAGLFRGLSAGGADAAEHVKAAVDKVVKDGEKLSARRRKKSGTGYSSRSFCLSAYSLFISEESMVFWSICL